METTGTTSSTTPPEGILPRESVLCSCHIGLTAQCSLVLAQLCKLVGYKVVDEVNSLATNRSTFIIDEAQSSYSDPL